MNYSALIENRKTFREFTDRKVSLASLKAVRMYYRNDVRRLIPNLKTQLYFFGTEARDALEGAAGYNQFLIGAPQYMVLLSEKDHLAHLNAGYIMEDLLIKLTDMNLSSCWLTFTDGEQIKHALGIRSSLDVAAIAAFGYGKKSVRRPHLNIRSMSEVDLVANRRYMEPERRVCELAYLNTWGNDAGLAEYIGFFDDLLWESLYAASLAPSYLNRQAYAFLLREGSIGLISRPDAYTPAVDRDLSLGAALLHFTAVAETMGAHLNWQFDADANGMNLPPDHRLIAASVL